MMTPAKRVTVSLPILDELVELNGWHRDHARAALRDAGTLKVVQPRRARAPRFPPHVIACLAT